MSLEKIFKPKTIAVIGASDEQGSVGYDLFNNLVKSDYKGTVYPVNIKRKIVQNIEAYPSIKECPENIDLAIIATPAPTVAGIVEECGRAGVGGLVVISAGFNEIGKEGQIMSEKILELSRHYGMRLIGPNCLGFIVPNLDLNASFANKKALPGRIAFISQSGALCTAVLDWSVANNVGFSYFVSIGSMIDVGFHDLVEYFGKDPKTSSIILYMESLSQAPEFLQAAEKLAHKKPIFVLKAGRSSAGAKAARSHTGSLAGNDEVFDAAFAKAGITRLNTIVDLFDCAMVMSMQPRPQGDRLAIVTNAGGPGVIAADAMIQYGCRLAEMEKSTVAKLDNVLPAAWSHNNPIDILGDADPARVRKTLEICLSDKHIDAVLAILTPQSMTDPTEVAKELVAMHDKLMKKSHSKTLLAVWLGGSVMAEGMKILADGKIPGFRSPEDAILTFKNLTSVYKPAAVLSGKNTEKARAFKPKTAANRQLLDEIIKQGRTSLTEAEAKAVLANYGIPAASNATVTSDKEASKAAGKIGFPLAMKILSPDILHKTDVGGVRLDITSRAEAVRAYNSIIRGARKHCPKADIQGVFMEEMVEKQYELLIGCKKDPIFGHVIVFGQGGITVELVKDMAIGFPPLDQAGSLRLIEKTKISRVLKGYRNLPGIDISALQFLLVKFSQLITDFPEIKELDINPFAVDEKGGVVLDAKIILGE